MEVDSKSRARLLGLGYFIHPIPAFSVAVLILNDHFLKAHFPGWITGKLSDFAGVFFFPLFICAVYGLLRRDFWIGPRATLLTIGITDVIFISVKLWPAANLFYLQLMFYLGFPSHLVLDPTDLVAVLMNPVTYYYARSFWLTDSLASPSS